MKKILGFSILDGEIVTVEKDSSKCVCIREKKYVLEIPISPISLTIHESEYKVGEMYDFIYDQNEDNNISNTYCVFINDSCYQPDNHFTKEEFDNHFKMIEDYRNDKIDSILK